jgi:peptidoglycan hydrolase CwlO-like protein
MNGQNGFFFRRSPEQKHGASSPLYRGHQAMSVIHPNFIILLLFLLVLAPLIYSLLFQRKVERKMSEIEKGIVNLAENYQSLLNAKNALANKVLTIQKATDYFQKTLDEKVKGLHQMFNSLGEKTNLLYNEREELIGKVKMHIKPLAGSLEDLKNEFNKLQESMKNVFGHNDEKWTELANHLDYFSDEIQKMKDHIRERNIDCEL